MDNFFFIVIVKNGANCQFLLPPSTPLTIQNNYQQVFYIASNFVFCRSEAVLVSHFTKPSFHKTANENSVAFTAKKT